MEVVYEIKTYNESDIIALAYNNYKKEIYTAAESEKSIKVWDLKNGMLLRVLEGHKGWISNLFYALKFKLLFSTGLDGALCIWNDRGSLLQKFNFKTPIFSLALNFKFGILAFGGTKQLQIFNIDTSDLPKLNQKARSDELNKNENIKTDINQHNTLLKRAFPTLKGPEYSHSDNVKAIVITDSGKIVTGGFDKCMCFYDWEKPKDSFIKIKKCHSAAINSIAYDSDHNRIITGSYDGSIRIWSTEGRCLEKFDKISDLNLNVTFVPAMQNYWITSNNNKITVIDPRGPENITMYLKETNQLDKYKITALHTPSDTDLLLGATKTKTVIAWKNAQSAAYRVFESDSSVGIECFKHIPVSLENNEILLTCHSNGKIKKWKIDQEQNCDIYKIQEEYHYHKKAIRCIDYNPNLECIITGGEDNLIYINYFSKFINNNNISLMPECLKGHEEKVTDVKILKDDIFISVSHDRSIRSWKIKDEITLQIIENAHEYPINQVDIDDKCENMATCATHHLVKIWDISDTSNIYLKLILDHKSKIVKEPKIIKKEKTCATLALNDELIALNTTTQTKIKLNLIDEVIQNANEDIPEITQVKWISFENCWITSADDNMIRFWNKKGEFIKFFNYEGGSVQHIFIDNINKIFIMTMLDKCIRLFTINNPIPIIIYKGHRDIIGTIAYVNEKGYYISASLDGSLRLWIRPFSLGGYLDQKHIKSNNLNNEKYTFVSNFIKEKPLIPPEHLNSDFSQIWKSIVAMEESSLELNEKEKRHLDMLFNAKAKGNYPEDLEKKLEALNNEIMKKETKTKRQSIFNTTAGVKGVVTAAGKFKRSL